MLNQSSQEDKKKEKHKIIIYGLIFIVVLATLVISLIPNHYIQPDNKFLSSIIRFGPYGQYGEVEINTFVKLLENVEMDNGEHPKILGWTQNNNEYTLHIIMKKPINLKVTHLLQSEYDGMYSVLSSIEPDNIPMDTFLLQIERLVPRKIIEKINTENYLEKHPIKAGFCLEDTEVHETALSGSKTFTTLKKGQEVSVTNEIVSVVTGTCGNDCGEHVWLEIVFLDSNQEFLLDSEYRLRKFYVKKSNIGFFDN